MGNIRVLDCTLRDGGYCNDWQFGFASIKKIIHSLVEANIDIVELGFLTNRTEYSPDRTKFTKLEQFREIIPADRRHKIFAAMINYGEYKADDIPEYDGSVIDGIRIAFHKKYFRQALEFCRLVKEKGYKVFIQAMVSLSYSDREFIELIEQVNDLQPYAFYIVDSFGTMKGGELTRLFYITDHNLDKNIYIGFHSHNNMQLAYSNAQRLLALKTDRSLILDCSVYGMGRGAGNLNTELFVDYLNENMNGNYSVQPLLAIIDEILNAFYSRNYWGYSLPNYISAVHNAHPNYAKYLDGKNTLTIESMNDIFDMMADDKKFEYDKAYIEALYQKYMAIGKAHEEHKSELGQILSGRDVLLIAPGKSSFDEREKIKEFSRTDNIITCSINFDYEYIDTRFIFISNLRRFRELEAGKKYKCIATSNIPSDEVYLRTKYEALTNAEEFVSDNGGLMAAKFFINCGVKNIYLAGFDGYSHDSDNNYALSDMSYIRANAVYDAMNMEMSAVLNGYSALASIKYLTAPRHVFIGERKTVL